MTTPSYRAKLTQSDPDATGLKTILNYQLVGTTRYFDAAGFPGRTIGLNAGTVAGQ